MVGQVSVKSKRSGIGWKEEHATKHPLACRITGQMSIEAESKRSRTVMSRQVKGQHKEGEISVGREK